MKRAERAIQIALVAWMRENYPHVMVHATLNEASYKDMPMGSCIGIPDLILWWVKDFKLHTFFLELKAKKGELSESQITWAEEMKPVAAQTYYAVAYGFSHAKEIILDIVPNGY